MLTDAVATATQLENLTNELAPEVGMPVPSDGRGVQQFAKVLSLALDAPDLSGVPFDAPEWESGTQKVRDLITSKVKRAELTAQYQDILVTKAWETDVKETKRDLNLYGRAWWRFLSGRYRRARDASTRLYVSRPPKTIDDQLAVLDAITTAQEAAKRYEAFEPLGPAYFGERWHVGTSGGEDWTQLTALTEWLADVYDQIRAGALPEYTVPLLNHGRLASQRERIGVFQAVVQSHQEVLERVRQLLEFDDARRFEGRSLGELPLAEQRDLLSDWQQESEKLSEIIALNYVLAELTVPELASLVDLSLSWPDAGEKLVATFKNAWFELLAESALRARPNLSQFSGENHNATIEKFRELDVMALDYNRQRLALQHYQSLPAASDHGQMRVLSREFQKKSRLLPIRQLMLKAGNAVQSIKPVFMMSPLSIAQFVPPQSLEFDLVVFDEASQVRPAEALGAIVRGDQTIVVGDSKQLPPTSFFSVFSQADEDEETATSEYRKCTGFICRAGRA